MFCNNLEGLLSPKPPLSPGIARDMSAAERAVVVPMLLEGFRDLAAEVGTYAL